MTHESDRQTEPATGSPASVRIPRHVAIIMDGNGRWAEKRGMPRIRGHEKGAESVRAAMLAARDIGIRYLTLYAFSVENWSRPKEEVRNLMRLLRSFLRLHERTLHRDRIRLRVLGRMTDLPEDVRTDLESVMHRTEAYSEWQLILALSYGGRREIVDAARHVAEAVRDGRLPAEAITEQVFSQYLYLPDVPDPDLIIRTSGEMRVSNFLLWEGSYSELYVTDVLWPDFRRKDLAAAVESYAGRERRFGKVSSPPR
jgi:undecaprenyl diphosphate synthase